MNPAHPVYPVRLASADLPSEIVIGYSQRFIHYLEFQEAVRLLRLIREHMPEGARLFLSASGLWSELGNGYVGAAQPLPRRFAPLSAAMAEKHDIRVRVCLYTPSELAELCQSAGFRCDRVYTSAFGNVKGVFSAA